MSNKGGKIFLFELIVYKKYLFETKYLRDIISGYILIGVRMIKSLCKIKAVKSTFHFTNVENLDSILKHGLMPSTDIKANCLAAKINDNLRLEGCPDANCISISYPNYKLFYTFRKKPEMNNAMWCVIELKSSILWDKKCRYCTNNAASSEQKENREADFNSFSKFINLFKNIPGKQNRILLGLPKSYPTNPQAEVLVFDVIESEYIKKIHFNNKRLFMKYNKNREYKQFEFVFDTTYLWGRKDHREWQNA